MNAARIAAIGLALGWTTAASADPVVLKLSPYRKTVAATVEVGGKPRLMAFDSGGGVAVITPAVAKDVGCTPVGKLVGFRMMGDRLDMPRCDHVAVTWSGQTFTADVAGVIDPTDLVAKDAAPIDGLLPLKLFDGQVVTLDFAGLAITLETPESAARRIEGAREVKLNLAREVGGRALAPYLVVPSSAGPLAFELDSGNGGTLLVNKTYAKALGFDPAAEGPQQGSIPIAENISATGLVFTPDMILDGNLGMPFLKDYLITLDLKNSRAWLKRNPTAAPAAMGSPPQMPSAK